MSLQRNTEVTGSLTSKNGIIVSINYKYNTLGTPNNINFSFSFNDNTSTNIFSNVNGVFDFTQNKIISYNVFGDGILSKDILDDIYEVLHEVYLNPTKIEDMPAVTK